MIYLDVAEYAKYMLESKKKYAIRRNYRYVYKSYMK